jgi:superfamily I DNA/RNA helicase
MKLTDEQRVIVDRLSDPNFNGNMKIIAYAGTGKTTTLMAICKALPNKKILNLSFNRSVADEAKTKFPGNVTSETFHGIAHIKMGKPDLVQNPKDFVNQYLKAYPEDSFWSVWGGYRTLVKFCETDATEITLAHALNEKNMDSYRNLSKNKGYTDMFVAVAKRMWDHWEANPDSKVLHPMYLKRFTLSTACELNEFDMLLVDEAQDANPSMLAILKKVKCQIVVVGDPHQQIYEFNGAINALDQCDYETYYLTQSFRFGEDIAEWSNDILLHTRAFDGTHLIRGKKKGRSIIREESDMGTEDLWNLDAVICRTNKDCYDSSKILVNNSIPYNFSNSKEAAKELDTILELRRNWPDKKRYMGCKSWLELVRYSGENSSDVPHAWMVQHVEKGMGNAIKDFVDGSVASGVYLTTAHRAKGLEWDHVLITGSYFADRKKISEEELRLFYVACTRAIKTLFIANSPDNYMEIMGDFVKKLKEQNIKVVKVSDIL